MLTPCDDFLFVYAVPTTRPGLCECFFMKAVFRVFAEEDRSKANPAGPSFLRWLSIVFKLDPCFDSSYKSCSFVISLLICALRIFDAAFELTAILLWWVLALTLRLGSDISKSILCGEIVLRALVYGGKSRLATEMLFKFFLRRYFMLGPDGVSFP